MAEPDTSSRFGGPERRPLLDLASALDVIAQLEEAVVSNRVISMAAGVLMGRHHVDAATAMEELRRTSNELNIKLTRVAQAVVDSANAQTPAAPSIGS